jgi:hypothetical protein
LPPSPQLETIADRYGRLPIAFERNDGQTDPRVQFLAHGRGYTLFLTGTEAVVTVGTGGAATAVRMTLVGAARDAGATAIDELPGVTNYFMDADPAKWRTNVRSYARVRYRQVYPGIDLSTTATSRSSNTTSSWRRARILRTSCSILEGTDRLELDARGHLLAHVAGGRLELKKPVAYQNGRPPQGRADSLRHSGEPGASPDSRVRQEPAADCRPGAVVLDTSGGQRQ